jgi:xylose isomerase
MLAFIATLDHPDMVGVNPEVGHEQMSGLNFYHVVAQALEAGKLFHIDLNDQKGPRFDQDLRFGSESFKNMFFLVRLLEAAYDGPRHFDAHSYRSENEEGVWEFAAGCMRNYLILKDKARQFDEDRDIKALLDEIHSTNGDHPEPLGRYSREKAQKLKDLPLDRIELARKPLPYERLDQLTVDILLGVR